MKLYAYKNYLTGLSIFVLGCFIVALHSCKKDKDDNVGSGTEMVNLELVADNLVAPLGVIESPDNTRRLFVTDQVGRIWIIKNGQKLNTPFIDLTGKIVALNPQYDERGLLGMAFHPDYKSNGKFYLFYTAPPRTGGPATGVSWNNLTRVSEFKVSSANADIADMSSERVILEADHPQMNHNGGMIAFGADGYLYIAIGDGGGAGDTAVGHEQDWYDANDGGNAQNIHANLMGKILRIDVNSGTPYSIPSDNPFTNRQGARGEIYAYGFRNPYRFSFDMGGSNQLYVGDAGQKLYEEIDLVTKGGNYGWNIKEGNICFNAANHLSPLGNCPNTDTFGNPLVDPLIQLKNAAHPDGGPATVIVGGYVYRGSDVSTLKGRYVFGIFSMNQSATAKIYSSNGSAYQEIKLKDYNPTLGLFLKGFGQDLAGEVYLTTSDVMGVSGSTGKIYKIVKAK
jgi:glucose/arabinose dehydrogenase